MHNTGCLKLGLVASQITPNIWNWSYMENNHVLDPNWLENLKQGDRVAHFDTKEGWSIRTIKRVTKIFIVIEFAEDEERRFSMRGNWPGVHIGGTDYVTALTVELETHINNSTPKNTVAIISRRRMELTVHILRLTIPHMSERQLAAIEDICKGVTITAQS